MNPDAHTLLIPLQRSFVASAGFVLALSLSVSVLLIPDLALAQGSQFSFSTSEVRTTLGASTIDQSDSNPSGLTSSASVTGNPGDAASAHTGLKTVRFHLPGGELDVISGDSGVAATTSGDRQNSTAVAQMGDLWVACVSGTSEQTCGSLLPHPVTVRAFIHLEGVIDPLLANPSLPPVDGSFVAAHLVYGVADIAQFVLDACYDQGGCTGGTGTMQATFTSGGIMRDVTPMLVFGTNASGQPTVSFDASFDWTLPECETTIETTTIKTGVTTTITTTVCFHDAFTGLAEIESLSSTNHVVDFSGSVTVGLVSLDPNVTFVSSGGRTAPGLPTALAVPIDVKPQGCPNPLNVQSQGVLPVAILGTSTFDVTQVDVSTVKLEGVSPIRSAFEDVATPFVPFTGKTQASDCTAQGPDGFLDLTLKFDTQAVVAALGTVTDGQVRVLHLTGNLMAASGGTAINGEDVVVILRK